MVRRCITVGRAGSGTATRYSGGCRISRPIWCAKVYEARPRLDGVVTWRLVEYLDWGTPSGKTASQKFIDKIEAMALDHGLDFIPDVKHGVRVQYNGALRNCPAPNHQQRT